MNDNESLRAEFLSMTALFMTAMAALTWGLSLLAGVPPFSHARLSAVDFVIGLAAAAGLALVFQFAQEERRQAGQILGAQLAACRWHDLVLLAAVVGCFEEALFRGVLEQWLGRWNEWGALVAVNVLFGALHAISWRYALLAGVLGVVMSLLVKFPGDDNLLRPIVAHGAYDLIGFIIIARDHRSERVSNADSKDSAPPPPASMQPPAH
jgi:membrane protease YdiL (CAAX protease family)